MAVGYYIRQGDKTTCGGTVLDAEPCITMFGEKPCSRRGRGFLRNNWQDLRDRRWDFAHAKQRQTLGRDIGQRQYLPLQSDADPLAKKCHLLLQGGRCAARRPYRSSTSHSSIPEQSSSTIPTRSFPRCERMLHRPSVTCRGSSARISGAGINNAPKPSWRQAVR